MQALRDAVDAELTEEDMQGIVRAFVDKAKQGDEKAAKFVIEYLMGGKFVPQSLTINNHYGNDGPTYPGRTIEVGRPSNRDRVYSYLEAAGPTKPAVIAADLELPLKTVTGTLNHKWFEKTGNGFQIARTNGATVG